MLQCGARPSEQWCCVVNNAEWRDPARFTEFGPHELIYSLHARLTVHIF